VFWRIKQYFAGTFYSTFLFEFMMGCFETNTLFCAVGNLALAVQNLLPRFLLYRSTGLAILLSGGKVGDAFGSE
jgi:hypothetical protein